MITSPLKESALSSALMLQTTSRRPEVRRHLSDTPELWLCVWWGVFIKPRPISPSLNQQHACHGRVAPGATNGCIIYNSRSASAYHLDKDALPSRHACVWCDAVTILGLRHRRSVRKKISSRQLSLVNVCLCHRALARARMCERARKCHSEL